MSNREVLSPTFTFLEVTRPRPRRNHKPSTPSSAVSPSYKSVSSLFDDDQLAAFFPALPAAGSPPSTPSPSSAPSVLRHSSDGYYWYPSIQKEPEDSPIVPADDAEEEKRREEEEEEGGKRSEARKEEEKGYERASSEEEKRREGGRGGGREGGGDEERIEKEEDEKEQNECREEGEEEEDTRRKRKEENVAKFSSCDDGDVFVTASDTTSVEASTCQAEAPMTETSPTARCPPPLCPPPPETLQMRRFSHPICLTPDSMPDSIPDSVPDSYTTDDVALMESLSSPFTAYEDHDLPLKFVFPPRISRLGSIYSHLGLTPSNEGSSCSDSESDTCEAVPEAASVGVKSRKYREKGSARQPKPERPVEFDQDKEVTDDAIFGSSRSSKSSYRRSSCGQTKKLPPPKPPRARASTRISYNDDRRKSREDPVRYQAVSDEGELRSKRSASMDSILEGNPEASEERRSRLSQGAEGQATGPMEVLPSPAEPQGSKKDRWHRRTRSSPRYKDAAKIVNSFISKKPPFAPFRHRREVKNVPHQKKAQGKDTEAPPPPPPSPPPPPPQTEDDVASPASHPNKQTWKDQQDAPTAGSLDKSQDTCTAHGALLNFYCVRCRVVVCRDCTVVAHSHGQHHKVLDTLDSLATLRSEAVAMLRHYTILDTMHASLAAIHRKFKAQHPDAQIAAIEKRLEEGKYLAEVVREAEQMVSKWTNLQQIRECVRQWEARQDEWGDLVLMASRCALLSDMNFPLDTVLLRMGSWVLPTPWIQLSHLLQPYLRTSKASPASTSQAKDDPLSPGSASKGLNIPSPQVPRRRSGSPYGGGTSSTGGTDKPFPYNARQMVLSNLVPYIILNPDIRYFVHIGGPRDVDVTLLVVPTDDHVHDCLNRRRNNATLSPEVLRQANYRPPVDAITQVEQQMTCGSCKTRITSSSMSLPPAAASVVVKVSFPDVKVLSDGHGLPAVQGGVRRGDVVVEQGTSGRAALTVVVRDMADYPALRLGHVTWGMDGLTCLVGTEDSKRAESGGFRAKIKATKKREEEAVYDVMFGLDL